MIPEMVEFSWDGDGDLSLSWSIIDGWSMDSNGGLTG